ncbi:APC family permease [Marinactinospora thermotolerans]|uniref:Amino acid/polyamine/organocation transporter, APC superfamily n=1 Tax=Marinactinospora thermotolerans DSM 45154 TaxID=1122192 RepID=A0A1T4T954_9ACTN|nr:APC family permease [Marinactinospora thermotolerans]SKA36678.1 amino acid/polyamine/organocation transporter, APC superfamily [Marinactinospora thermotolerans DSM 45154]
MSDHGNDGFARVLGRGDVLALAFGAMIGFGWVVLTGEFLTGAGSLGAALAFVIGGTVVALVGLTYAELVSAMPRAGGEHNYALRGLGAHGGFVASWGIVLGYVTVVAFEAVALPETVLYLFPDMRVGHMWTVAGYDVYASWAAVGVVAALVITAVNYVGIRPAGVFQAVAVLFLLAVGVALATGTLVGGSAANMRPLFDGGVSGLVAVLVATPFLFVGFDVIPQSAEEIRVPYRQVGRLLLVSVGCATAWYVLVMLAVGAALPREELAGARLASAEGMAALWDSPAMGTVLVLGGIAGILTSWNAFLIGASRLLYAMASSGMLPRWFARLHPRYRTPSNALLFIGGLSVLAPLFGDRMLSWLVNAGGVNIVVAYVVVALSFLVLRRREPGMPRPFRAPAGNLVGALALVLSLGLATLYLPGMPAALTWPYEWGIVGAWWLLGGVFLWRLPRVGAGPQAEERLLAELARRTARRRDGAGAG